MFPSPVRSYLRATRSSGTTNNSPARKRRDVRAGEGVTNYGNSFKTRGRRLAPSHRQPGGQGRPLPPVPRITSAGAGGKRRAEWSRTEPSRAEPGRAGPSGAERSRVEPSRAEPSRAGRSLPPGGACKRASLSQGGGNRRKDDIFFITSYNHFPSFLKSQSKLQGGGLLPEARVSPLSVSL